MFGPCVAMTLMVSYIISPVLIQGLQGLKGSKGQLGMKGTKGAEGVKGEKGIKGEYDRVRKTVLCESEGLRVQ